MQRRRESEVAVAGALCVLPPVCLLVYGMRRVCASAPVICRLPRLRAGAGAAVPLARRGDGARRAGRRVMFALEMLHMFFR